MPRHKVEEGESIGGASWKRGRKRERVRGRDGVRGEERGMG